MTIALVAIGFLVLLGLAGAGGGDPPGGDCGGYD